MKLRIKSMFWNIRKQKATNQDKKKKESKNMRMVKTDSGTNSSHPIFTSEGCQKEKKRSKKLEI